MVRWQISESQAYVLQGILQTQVIVSNGKACPSYMFWLWALYFPVSIR